MRSKQRFGKADAAGISVVQVQVWFEKFPDVGRGCVFQGGRIEILRCALQGRSTLRRLNVRRTFGIGSGRTFADGCSKVAAVAHQEKRGHRFKRMQQAEHSALPFAYGERKRFEQWAFQRNPVSGRVHFVFREFKLPVADIFVREEFDFLEAHDLRAHQDIAVRMKMRGSLLASPLFSRGNFQDANLRIPDGVGVVVDVDAFHVSFAFLEVEVFNVVLLAAVNVNGFFVQENKCAREIYFANNGRRAGDIDDYEIVAGDRAQADGISRIGFLRPVIIFSGEMKKSGRREPRAQVQKIDIAEFVVRRYWQFERGAFQMIYQNFQVVRLNKSVLRRVAEEIIRMVHDELIERRRRRHQHGAGTSAAPPGAAGALPGGGDRAGISGHDDGIERPDIDAKFESAGRNHAANLSVAQAALDFATLVRQVAAAIAANRFLFSWELRISLLQIGEKNLRLQPRIGKDDGLQIALQKFLSDTRGFIDVAAANAQRAIHDRRIVKDKSFFGCGSAVRVENFDFGFEKA